LPGYNASDPDTVAGFGSASSTSFMEELDLSGNGITNLDFSQPSGNNAEFSAEAWVNAVPTNALNARIIQKGHFFGEQFALDLGTTSPSTAFRFTVRDAASTEHDARGTIVPDNKWHHVVGVCDGVNGYLYLYIDGVLNATNNFNPSFPPGSGLYAVNELMSFGNGDTSSTGGGTFTAQLIGSVAEVALYNYPLAASQVAAHYRAGITLAPGELLNITNLGSAQFKLTWNYGTLQGATNVAGPYLDMPAAASPYLVPATNAQQYYRVRIQ